MSIKFYLARIKEQDNDNFIQEIKKIKEIKDESFTYTTPSKKEFIFKVNIQAVEDYYFIEFLGGQKAPYSSEVIDIQDNNKVKPNPRASQEPEISERYNYLIHKKTGHFLGKRNSFVALSQFYKTNLNTDINISYFCYNIDEYLQELEKVLSLTIKLQIDPQGNLNFWKTLDSDEIEKFGFSTGTAASVEIKPKEHDIKKFKKNIKQYDAKFIRIYGQNNDGNPYIYTTNATKSIFEITEDDKICDQLLAKLKKWVENDMET
jgi:hypothetical protein